MTWLPALRIARRDALRAKGRSALIVAMVALPVLGIGGADILLRSAQLDPDERLARELGRTQARLTFMGGGRVIQPPDPDREGATMLGADRGATASPTPPSGYRVLVSREGELTFRTSGGVAPLAVHEIAVGDPAFTGKFSVEDGRAPRADGEIAVTRVALDRLGSRVGGTAELVDSGRRVRIVGVVESAAGPATVWAQPGALLAGGSDTQGVPDTLYLAGSRPVTWEDVLRLNRDGVLVFSRAVLLDPPPRSEVPYYTRGLAYAEAGEAALTTILAVGLAVTLAVLEVMLLAGAAFAVGARRQARSLGLVTAAGGEPRDVRRVVLAGGLVLGTTGALVGLALALAVSAAAIPLLERWTMSDFGRYDLRPLELGAALLVGMVAALLAAVLPARTAARQNPVAALTGRRGQVRTPRKVPAIGVGLAGLGIVVSALGSIVALSTAAGVNPAGSGSALLAAGLIAAGAALIQIGLIICSSTIVGLAGRLSRRLPLALRFALTDASRHRGRSAPAVAAVLTAVTGATALALVAASFDARDRADYIPAWPPGTAGVFLQQFATDATGASTVSLVDPDRVVATAERHLPSFRTITLRSEPECVDVDGCPFAYPAMPATTHSYEGGALPPTPVGDAELVRFFAGRVSEAARDTLAGGGVVALDPSFVVDGRLTVERTSADGRRTRRVKLPAVALETPSPAVIAIYSEGAAQRLGLRLAPTHVLMAFEELPTVEQEDAAREALRDAGVEAELTVERGYQSDYAAGLLALVLAAAVITLGAAGIATGLAQADARADHATLAAVGATPGLRRTLASAQALSVAGLGTLLGLFAGLVPGLAFIGAVDSLELAVPWLTLVEVLVGIPLVAAVCAWLMTRSRLPLERRVAL